MAAKKKAKTQEKTPQKKSVRIKVEDSEPKKTVTKTKKPKAAVSAKKTASKASKKPKAASTKSAPANKKPQMKKTTTKKATVAATKAKTAKEPENIDTPVKNNAEDVAQEDDFAAAQNNQAQPEPLQQEPEEQEQTLGQEVDYSAEFTEDNLIFEDITSKKPLFVGKLLRTLILIILFALAISLVMTGRAGLPSLNFSDSDEDTVTIDSVEGRYLFTGTIVWDRNIEEWSKDEAGVIDFEQPFSGLASYNPSDYDAWVTDLECPISSEDIPYEVGLTTLEFNCRPEYLPFAAEYFEFMNLANNHSDNSGRDKLDETRVRLAAAGTQYFGDPDPSITDEVCEVVGLPVRQKMSTGLVVESRMPVAFCAWHYFLRLPLAGEIEEMQKYAEVMPVFAFLHMGPEYKTEANIFQVQMARDVIDSGADFVIANNPHWVQNAEVYKDKLIVYSTGNFIFDQTWSEEVGSSANIDALVDFTLNEDTEEWLAMGESCTAHADDCLERAIARGLQKQEATFTYDLIAGDIRDRLQSRADETVQAFVEDRLGWPNILAQLGQD